MEGAGITLKAVKQFGMPAQRLGTVVSRDAVAQTLGGYPNVLREQAGPGSRRGESTSVAAAGGLVTVTDPWKLDLCAAADSGCDAASRS